MKVWPIDPLVPQSSRLEVPEKLKCVDFGSEAPVCLASPRYADDTNKLTGTL